MAEIAIVGAGGVGGLVGACLARAGHDVRFVARGATLEALRARGIVVHAPDGSETTTPVRAAEDPSELGAADVVLVAVKTWQLGDVAPRLLPLVRRGTAVVPLQNGVDAADVLAKSLGEASVIGGLCAMLSWTEGPAIVRWMGAPPSVTVGARHADQEERVEACAAALRRGVPLRVEVADDVDASLWKKLLFLAPLAAVGAAARAPAGALRRIPETRALLRAAMEEIARVGRARGVRLGDDVVEQAMRRVDGLPEDATASMHRDVVDGRPSELHELVGAAVRIGRELGVDVPACSALYATLLPQEERARASRRAS